MGRHRRYDRDLMTDAAVLRELSFVVAYSPNVVRRRIHVLVRDEHDLGMALGFNVIEPFALFVH